MAPVEQKQIWDVMPHILGGGDGAVSATLQHLARQSAALSEDVPSLPSDKERMAVQLVDIAIRRHSARQIWTYETPLQEVDHEYIAFIIRMISERVLGPLASHAPGHPGRVDAEALHRRISACGLAAYLARSLPTQYAHDEKHSIVSDQVASLVSHVRSVHEQVNLSADRRLRWHFDILLRHLTHLFSSIDAEAHPNLAPAKLALDTIQALEIRRRRTKSYDDGRRF